MAKIISCVNLKGGVGKTALAVNLAAYCGAHGLKTLLVDLDPQTNATFSCMKLAAWEKHASKKGSVADLLGVKRHSSAEDAKRSAADVIIRDVFPNVDLIPSHLDLFTVDLDLGAMTARETLLRRALTPVLADYAVVVCDCPPNLTIPTQNALAVSTHYVVPISPDYLAGIGIGLLVERVAKLCRALEHEIEHVGIVISRYGRPAIHRSQSVAAIRTAFPKLIMKPYIRERVAVAEAAAKNRPVYDMSDAEASAEFRLISKQIIQRMGLTL